MKRLILAFAMLAAIPVAADDWVRLHWIDKVGRTLRLGHGLEAGDPVDALLRASDDEVIDYFFRDPRTADSYVDFHRAFLGQRTNSLRSQDGAYLPEALLLQAPWNAAQAILSHGDFLEAFSFRQPLFLPKLANPTPSTPEEAALPPNELRLNRVRKLIADFEEILAYATGSPTPTQVQVCRKVKLKLLGLSSLGIPQSLVRELLDSENAYGRLSGACSLNRADGVVLVDELRRVHGVGESLLHAFSGLSTYDPRSVADVVRVDGGPLVHQFSGAIRDVLVNSSTNSNRKRGAYILKRFFCDDLVPVSADQPAEHAGQQHGSQAACASCHYKLDPMAGFFRNYGAQFFDFSSSAKIVFDDNAEKPLADYTRSWLADPATGRTWEVGYVRSSRFVEKNEYGENLEDLFKIIRKAPEFRSCLTRRMFEYFVAEGQLIDPAYIEELAAHFKRAQADARPSSDAFAGILRALLKSQSFRQLEPDPGTCYDLAQGVDPATRPPCRVAAILERNCRSCHSGADPEAGLDLTRWMRLADGQFSFVHLDEVTGQQVPKAETFRRLVDRLSTTDESRRMPRSRFMTSQDRQALYLWSNTEGLR